MPSTYVITGAARGIGYEFAKQLAADGHTVVATTRSESPALHALASSSSGKVSVLTCDLASAESVASFGQQLAKTVSRVDVLINNAGIATSPPDETIENVSPERIMDQINTNVVGTLLATRAVAPLFGAGTKVVNISSLVASFSLTLKSPIPMATSYSISKAALNMLTVKQSLFYKDCVVAALEPGLVKTDMNPNGTVSAPDAVTAMLKVVAGFGEKDSGSFASWDGKKAEW